MQRCSDHNFMRTNSVHLIIDPFAFSVQLSFYPEGRELIGDHSKCPAGSVRRSSIFSKRNDLWRGFILIPFTEGAEPTDRSSLLCYKIRGPSSPLCGNDHPPSMDWISSEL